MQQHVKVYVSCSNDDEGGTKARYTDGRYIEGVGEDLFPDWVCSNPWETPLYRVSDRLLAGEHGLIELSITSDQPLDPDLCNPIFEIAARIGKSETTDNPELIEEMSKHPYGKDFTLVVQF